MQAGPDARLGPVSKPTPGRHPGTTQHPTRYVAPGHALAQDVDDASQRDPIRHREPPGVAMPSHGPGWQQRGYPIPQLVGDKVRDHDAEACQRTLLSSSG